MALPKEKVGEKEIEINVDDYSEDDYPGTSMLYYT